ncbi:MAG: pteridine reductase [Pseudomonadota bacterium]
MSQSDADRVMLVTGASQRIGAAIARRAHQHGYRVVVHFRGSAPAASALTESLNASRADSAICLQADFAELDGCEQLIQAATRHWDRLDVLVNNASEFFPTAVGQITQADLHRTFNANVFAPLLLTQAAMPQLSRCDGAVVNILDIYAQHVKPDHSVYCASKAALAMLTRSLAVDCAPQVRVNGIAPGAILWPEGESALTDHEKAALLSAIPLGKTGSAEQIAAAVIYLCSSDAEFITGQTLAIDGGRTAH